jgi:hypothetical protein
MTSSVALTAHAASSPRKLLNGQESGSEKTTVADVIKKQREGLEGTSYKNSNKVFRDAENYPELQERYGGRLGQAVSTVAKGLNEDRREARTEHHP